MLRYDRIDASEGIDTNKTDILLECIISLSVNFIFQPKLSDGCHDVTQKSASFAIVTIKRNDYKINF